MLKERAREVSLMVAALDLFLLVISFLAAYGIRAHVLPGYVDSLGYVPIGPYVWLLLVSLPLFYLLFRAFRLYDSMRTMSLPHVTLAVGKPFAVAGVVLGSLIFLVQDKTFSRFIFLSFLGIHFTLVMLEKIAIRLIQKQVRRRGYNSRNILIVGVGPEAARMVRLLDGHDHLGMRVIGHLSLDGEPRSAEIRAAVLGRAEDLPRILDHQIIDEVLFAIPGRDLLALEGLIWKCEEVGVRVHLKADFISTLLSRTYTGEIEGIPILTLASTPHTAGAILLKRVMDMIVSGVGLLVLGPLMALIAVLVKVTSPGPVLYRQVRAGLNGRRFVLLKFRSMYQDAEEKRAALQTRNEMSGPVFKMRHDPRVTPVGRALRRWSLDELPQLWNVLRGDMSIVGPRPPIPEEVDQYQRWQRRRLSMKPGLTCLWQVNGRNEIGFEDWMKMDMDYIDNWSLGLDFRILARTVSAVVSARGAR